MTSSARAAWKVLRIRLICCRVCCLNRSAWQRKHL